MSSQRPMHDRDTAESSAPRLGCVAGCFFASIGFVLIISVALGIVFRPDGRAEWKRANRLDEEHCKRVLESDPAFARVHPVIGDSSKTGRTFTGMQGMVATKDDLARLKTAIGRLTSITEEEAYRVRVAGEILPADTAVPAR